ncbi:histidine kinase [Nocardioides lentus]|uniref:histidine kinase n=2 Tax=Nocardioides lentus TaxID=338077 RepID=A0ABN2PF10_9ACTN
MLVISVAGFSTAVLEGSRETTLMLGLELVGGLVAYALVWWRRRFPMSVLLVVSVVGVVSGLAAGPAVLAAVSVATRRRTAELVTVFVVTMASTQGYALLAPVESDPWWVTLGANLVGTVATVAAGMYIGSRRELLWTLRQRAERAEAEQELRVDRARVGERAAIAREMHDVLAHRISQISMHAGALSIRGDLDADALRDGAATIQARANEALDDLRDVLGVLRDTGSGELAARPQPTYCDLPELVAAAREHGLRVHLVDHLVDAEHLPVVVGRTLYRIVQEGITNAAKHAPGTTATVVLTGDRDVGVTVEVRNPRPVGVRPGPPATPGAGLGLLGLSERAELRGGRLTHHDDGGEFVLRGWVPWTS